MGNGMGNIYVMCEYILFTISLLDNFDLVSFSSTQLDKDTLSVFRVERPSVYFLIVNVMSLLSSKLPDKKT